MKLEKRNTTELSSWPTTRAGPPPSAPARPVRGSVHDGTPSTDTSVTSTCCGTLVAGLKSRSTTTSPPRVPNSMRPSARRKAQFSLKKLSLGSLWKYRYSILRVDGE